MLITKLIYIHWGHGLHVTFYRRKRSLQRLCLHSCLFVHRGVLGLCPGGLCPGRSLSRGSLSRGVSVQGDLCPGRSLSRGVSVQGGGLCQGDLLYSNERTVRILLECILVVDIFSTIFGLSVLLLHISGWSRKTALCMVDNLIPIYRKPTKMTEFTYNVTSKYRQKSCHN